MTMAKLDSLHYLPQHLLAVALIGTGWVLLKVVQSHAVHKLEHQVEPFLPPKDLNEVDQVLVAELLGKSERRIQPIGHIELLATFGSSMLS